MGNTRRAATEAESKALASAVRLRILRLCLDEPLTNKQIAARLDAHPATTLHHVRTLVATGFLAPEGERRGARSAREIPYRATGKSWTLDVSEAGRSGPGLAMLEAFRQEIDLVDDLNEVLMSRLGMRLTEAERDELMRRLQAVLDEFSERVVPPDRPDRPYSLFLILHPDVTRTVR